MARSRFSALLIVASGLLLTASSLAQADCSGPPARSTTVVVRHCSVIDPAQEPLLMDALQQWRADDRNRVLPRYRGLQLQTDQGPVFVAASHQLSCGQFALSQPLPMTLDSACCDGDSNPPCYLGYRQFFTRFD